MDCEVRHGVLWRTLALRVLVIENGEQRKVPDAWLIIQKGLHAGFWSGLKASASYSHRGKWSS